MTAERASVATLPLMPADPEGRTRESRRIAERVLLAGAIAFQLILVTVLGYLNRYQINTDGISFIRLAVYYAHGQWDLAVSGYWGPLLSWLMVPFVGLFETPLFAARVAMGASAVVCLLGAMSVLRRIALPASGVVLGSWIVALASAVWATGHTSADVLFAGLVCFAVSRLLDPRWSADLRTQITTGLLFAAAYLAKAAAVPLALALTLVIPTLWVLTGSVDFKRATRGAAITLIVFGLAATPWVTVLSLKYGKVLLSTSGRINHSAYGPRTPERLRFAYELESYHVPPPGRVTTWEEPSNTPVLEWSPFASADNALHQLKLIYQNLFGIAAKLAQMDWLGVGLFAAVSGVLVHAPWLANMRAQRWRWAGIIVMCLSSAYLPISGHETRYHYPAYVFLVVAAVGSVYWLTREGARGANVGRLIGLTIVVMSFAKPNVERIQDEYSAAAIAQGRGVLARAMAARLAEHDVRGPIADGLAEQKKHPGLAVAFHMNQPWYGGDARIDPAAAVASGAEIFITQRSSAWARSVDRHPAFESLDPVLFGSTDEADRSPWKAYRISRAASPAAHPSTASP